MAKATPEDSPGASRLTRRFPGLRQAAPGLAAADRRLDLHRLVWPSLPLSLPLGWFRARSVGWFGAEVWCIGGVPSEPETPKPNEVTSKPKVPSGFQLPLAVWLETPLRAARNIASHLAAQSKIARVLATCGSVHTVEQCFQPWLLRRCEMGRHGKTPHKSRTSEIACPHVGARADVFPRQASGRHVWSQLQCMLLFLTTQ